MDLVECIDDTDRNGVFKITPDLDQVFIIEQSNGEGKRTRQVFNLNFNFLPAEDDSEGV